ncbi:YidB family protein [Alsobacter sp. SYSU M60028]|uniref:YidB family protein n=1 Tax=Alsobacter ponti TaxID=2962936 RepID=A0ABT1L8V3_9HYPH|nr:YidB family protein [Alsobacter ponti]MCP8937894.1 YidB family protein [Alsobacter ponti]
MTALLGLLAVAGYQNRDKIAEMLRGGQSAPDGLSSTSAGGASSGAGGGLLGGLLGGLGGLGGGLGGGAGAGGLLSGGLSELVERFRQNGHGEAADSWVSPGPNRELPPNQLEQAIGPDVLDHLEQQTGLSRDEILSRLQRELPKAVDDLTPQGRLPSPQDFDQSGNNPLRGARA